MSNPNYGRQEKSSGYNHANSIPVEVVAVEAYSVDSYYPPNPPASVDVPSFRDGTYQTSMTPFSLLCPTIHGWIPMQYLNTQMRLEIIYPDHLGQMGYRKFSSLAYWQFRRDISSVTIRVVWYRVTDIELSEKAQQPGATWKMPEMHCQTFLMPKNLNFVNQIDQLFSLVRDDGESTFPRRLSQCC